MDPCSGVPLRIDQGVFDDCELTGIIRKSGQDWKCLPEVLCSDVGISMPPRPQTLRNCMHGSRAIVGMNSLGRFVGVSKRRQQRINTCFI